MLATELHMGWLIFLYKVGIRFPSSSGFFSLFLIKTGLPIVCMTGPDNHPLLWTFYIKSLKYGPENELLGLEFRFLPEKKLAFLGRVLCVNLSYKEKGETHIDEKSQCLELFQSDELHKAGNAGQLEYGTACRQAQPRHAGFAARRKETRCECGRLGEEIIT